MNPPCAICGAPTQDALVGNRLLLGSDVHHLPTEDAPTIFWRCRTHQRYEMRRALGVQVSAQGDLLFTLTCGHEVRWVFRGQIGKQKAYTPARLALAISTRQIRLEQPQRCYLCGDLQQEGAANP
jgi:hypothetical protein